MVLLRIILVSHQVVAVPKSCLFLQTRFFQSLLLTSALACVTHLAWFVYGVTHERKKVHLNGNFSSSRYYWCPPTTLIPLIFLCQRTRIIFSAHSWESLENGVHGQQLTEWWMDHSFRFPSPCYVKRWKGRKHAGKGELFIWSAMRRHQRLDESESVEPRREFVFPSPSRSRSRGAILPRRSRSLSSQSTRMEFFCFVSLPRIMWLRREQEYLLGGRGGGGEAGGWEGDGRGGRDGGGQGPGLLHLLPTSWCRRRLPSLPPF